MASVAQTEQALVPTEAPAKKKGKVWRDKLEHFIEALHDIVSDSETDSGDEADADMTKKDMAKAVQIVGDKYKSVAAERVILAKQVTDLQRQIKKLEAKNASLLAEHAKAATQLEKVAITNEIADNKEQLGEKKDELKLLSE